jgi:hypothetical protein
MNVQDVTIIALSVLPYSERLQCGHELQNQF